MSSEFNCGFNFFKYDDSKWFELNDSEYVESNIHEIDNVKFFYIIYNYSGY